jgi:hypothetical protein
MPAGFIGDIEVNGLGLFEKSKWEVEADRAEQTAKAKQMVDDWAKSTGALFEGEFKIGGERTEIGATKTIENTTKIPRELTPYIAQIFEKRDRIARLYTNGDKSGFILAIEIEMDDAMKNNPDAFASKWPTLNAIILPFAIENIRKRIAEEATSGQASEH